MSEALKLWFFRDLNNQQRLKLFGLFGFPVEAIGDTLGKQEIALRHVMQKLVAVVRDETVAALAQQTPPPSHIVMGSRWRVFEDTTHGYWGIEREQASNDDDPIMYSIKIHRERVAIVVDAHNAEVARLESLHRSEIADMAERFRSVNVSEAVKQLADILPAPAGRLVDAAKDVITSSSDTYKKRNGHIASFEDDSGEKCWIVPFDAFEGLRSAVAAISASEVEG